MDVFLVRFLAEREHVREKAGPPRGACSACGSARADEVAAKRRGASSRRRLAARLPSASTASSRRSPGGVSSTAPVRAEQPAHVGRQDGPVHELGPQAAVRRGEVAALAHGQLFSGDFHRAAQAGGHGRVARQDVERVPVRDVPPRGGRAGPGRWPSSPRLRAALGTRRRAAASARSKEVVGILAGQRVPDGHGANRQPSERGTPPPERPSLGDMACMNGAECSGTRACSRTEARSGMASSRFCGNGPLPDTRFPADLSRAGRRFGVWDAGRSARRGGRVGHRAGAWSGGTDPFQECRSACGAKLRKRYQ